ncbi:MAG TPA: hypothetical protein PK668_15215 [Myxococcota bacterium]|nr:hypothetical protein [Myxococcota bacterium]HRY94245.1 hypothetical protein [Myxococcota bacterium]
MAWITIAALLVLGVLGASSIILAKKPDAKELIEKLSKYGGWVGVVAAIWGVWIVIQSLLNLGWLGAGLYFLVLWASYLATGLVLLFLGFIFGYGMITTYLSAEARAKGEQVRAKLVGFQAKLGIVSIILAVWWLVFSFILAPMWLAAAISA